MYQRAIEPRKVLSLMAEKKETKYDEPILMATRVQAIISSYDCMMGGDFIEAFDRKVKQYLKECCDRTKNFGKKTVGSESV